MSLYRAGLELASFLPLGIALATFAALGFTDVSPVIHFAFTGKGDLILIEPASVSDSPLALHAYPVILFNRWLPDRQGRPATSLDKF